MRMSLTYLNYLVILCLIKIGYSCLYSMYWIYTSTSIADVAAPITNLLVCL
jgi:hypothetical protein